MSEMEQSIVNEPIDFASAKPELGSRFVKKIRVVRPQRLMIVAVDSRYACK